MKKMTSNKWILLLVLFLVMTNLVLAFLLFTKEVRNSNSEPYLVRHMKGLSDSQKDMLRRKKEEFIRKTNPKWEDINSLKEKFYHHLGDENLSDSLIHHYIVLLNEKNSESDSLLFQHFREMRNEFNDEQKKITIL